MKKFALATLAIALTGSWNVFSNTLERTTSFLVMDGITGSSLVQNHQFDIINPLEHVRLMTLLTAFELMKEKGITGDKRVRIYDYDIKEADSKETIHLKDGDIVELEDLLRAVAIVGSQDASLAVASFLGSTRQEFVQAMNRTAERLGMKRSWFTSPIATEGQQSCAYDLALLTRELQIKHKDRFSWFYDKAFDFKGKKYKNKHRTVFSKPISDGYFISQNTNNVILSFEDKSPKSNVHRYLISIVLSEPKTAFNSAMNLLRNAVVDYNIIKLYEPYQKIGSLKLINGSQDTIAIGSVNSIYISLHKDQLSADVIKRLHARIDFTGPKSAPIKKGQPIGELIIELDKNLIGKFPVISLETIDLGTFPQRMKNAVQLGEFYSSL